MLLDGTKKMIEALLFIKGEEGLSIEFVSNFMDLEQHEAENILNIFTEEYNKNDSYLVVKNFGATYKLLVEDKAYDKIKHVISSKNLVKLSKASIETLAIIAYNQPITKVQIDKIRGVSSDSIIHSLIAKELIVSNKTLDTIGKPKLYETTDLFLDVFGLESLDKLPKSNVLDNNELNNFLENKEEIMAERLQKLIAASGYTSRRKAEQLILDGKVTVNGTVVNQLGVKAEPSDIIIVEGVRLLKENKRYYLFYKPEKVITSMSDEKDRTCVKDFFESVNERVVPVGRLDYDTSGALIMSNDGEFINLITHPRHKIKKTYVAKISGKLDDRHLKILRSGVRIDNYKTAPAEVNIVKNKNKSSNTLVRLTIHEGKNRQIRRMFETLGYEVLKLKREAIEDLTLEGLKKGEYRVLTIHEVKRLINKANNGEK